ncbi:MAG: SPOR domain-containing protein [Deltaproteobacteria bacterium]|nr:SPOR domain-containing protein [Deltaproteobacteria bacterium]
MVEQDDLFRNKADQQPDEDVSLTGRAGEEDQPQAFQDIAGSGIATGEVRAVEVPPRRSSSNLLILLMLSAVALFGVGYYLLSGGPPAHDQPANAVQRQPIPQRPVGVEPVTKEAVAQQPVAAAGSVVAPETEKTAAVASPPVPPAGGMEATTKPVARPLVATTPTKTTPLYRVMVGPYLNRAAVKKATGQLRELGFEAQPVKGRGMVTMTRLLEGVYPLAEARARLAKIKINIGAAFMLPHGDDWAIYVGSFSDRTRAARYAEELAKKKLKVTQVRSDVEMSGKMLIALQADQKTALQVAALIGKSGLTAQVVRK